jgi:hypothetical protein
MRMINCPGSVSTSIHWPVVNPSGSSQRPDLPPLGR